MDLQVLKKEYPKSYKLFHAKTFQTVVELIMKSARKIAEETGETIPEMPEGFVSLEEIDSTLDSIISNNPYGLFEILDDNDIKIAIIPHPEDDNGWLHYNNVEKESFRETSRKNAEVKAFENAIKLLEKQL